MGVITPMRMAGQRLAATIAKRAQAAEPFGPMEALKNAARFHGPADVAMRVGPDLLFGGMGALGPGGLPAGAIDVGANVIGSYGGEVAGAGIGAALAGLVGASPRVGADVGRTIGGFTGNFGSAFFPNQPRNDAIKKEQQAYEQQLLSQAQGMAQEPVMGPGSLDTETTMETRARQCGLDPDDPLAQFYLRQL